MMIAPTLNIPQARFLAMPHKFKAYVAGFGSGKTWVGCGGICKGMWEFPRINQGYFAPTYPQIRDIFYPTVEEVAHDWGMRVQINESNKEVHFYAGRQYRGTTICRSMEKPETIVGFKIGNALIDELDVMKKEKAQKAWRKIIARMRYKVDGLRNGIDVTTTPEGFKFVWLQFVKEVRDKPELATLYGLVQASTFDNEKNLPPDYIPSLMGSYPPELIKAYLRGQFTNLTSGTIYHQFDRRLNNCDEVEQPGEPLYIGMDFNVGKMAGIVHVLRLGLPCAVNEIINAYDTPDMIRIIKERFWLYDGADYRKVREIYIYPDASGDSRKSNNASKTDIAQLQDAGFNVIVDNANPPVKDRINAMNAMFCNANDERRYKVNVARCPVYTECLEQQVWDEKTGEPDKKSDNDHPNDGAGYYIHKTFPIIKPVTNLNIGFAY
ncbi:terminase [Serratia ureilytica]|uniref:terminase large subunit domain-containing protein n=1 Tax=Serratia ureilytica TaxID=300181 RepID=UPI0018A708FC|nr:terminase family protein [Serratia ureilytica]MBF4187683.1 terminase [Serratia ureilytica]MBF8442888.1 terminase [Serratia ureilytica]MBF8447678.1 terminase [Serratia ureilytica]